MVVLFSVMSIVMSCLDGWADGQTDEWVGFFGLIDERMGGFGWMIGFGWMDLDG